MGSSSVFIQTANAMLEVPFAPNVSSPVRVEQLHETGDALTGLLIDGFKKGPQRAAAYRATMVLACEPSLESIANGDRHTGAVAEKVNEKARSLASFMIEFAGLDNWPSQIVLGAASEIAIWGLGWWGIAEGHVTENSYVLPSTSSQDTSDPGGRRNGFDLRACIGGRHPLRRPIQIKTKPSDRDKIYRPDIVPISPSMVLSPTKGRMKHLSTFRLTQYLADNDKGELGYAFRRLMDELKKKRD